MAVVEAELAGQAVVSVSMTGACTGVVTELRPPMARIRVSQVIDAPPDEVWQAVEDIAEPRRLDGRRRGHPVHSPTAAAGVGHELRLRHQDRPVPARRRDGDHRVAARQGHGRAPHRAGHRRGRHPPRSGRGGRRTRFMWDERLRFPWYFGGPVGGARRRPQAGAHQPGVEGATSGELERRIEASAGAPREALSRGDAEAGRRLAGRRGRSRRTRRADLTTPPRPATAASSRPAGALVEEPRRRDDAADEAADVATDRDAGDQEGEEQVDADQRDRCRVDHGSIPRARWATKRAPISPNTAPEAPTVRALGSQEHHAERAAQQRREVDGGEPRPAQRRLEDRRRAGTAGTC